MSNPFVDPPKTKSELVKEMCRRVDLPLAVGNRILAIVINHAVNTNRNVDMILVAQGISYAGKNKHLLKRNY